MNRFPIALLKCLLPFIDPKLRPLMIAYFLMTELKTSLLEYQSLQTSAVMNETKKAPSSIKEMLDLISPYLNKSELDNLRSILDTIDTFSILKECMDMDEEENGTKTGSGGFDMASILSLINQTK